MSNQYDMQIKVLMIGDSGVGKTSMLIRYANDTFSSSFITTIGIDFKHKSLIIDDKNIKLQIWDTAGQERFRTITTSYFRSAQGIILVYDITDKTSLLSIKNWINKIHQHSDIGVNKILVGNKCDNNSERVISFEEGEKIAKEYDMEFFECSAKSDINISKLFTRISEQVVKRLLSEDDNKKTKPNVIIRPNEPKKSKCC